jgi:Glu-tRNA(Gln) amidotransferase subunit E-like FAD-binding protein
VTIVFETLDVVISLAVVFLILSMVHKYLMSIIKRLLKIKANVVAEEMKTFVGQNASEYLIPYLAKKAQYLNFLEDTRIKRGRKEGDKGLRRLNKEQLKEMVTSLKEFLESKSGKEIKEELGLTVSEDEIKRKIEEIKDHLCTLKDKIENIYDNTLEKMAIDGTRREGIEKRWPKPHK